MVMVDHGEGIIFGEREAGGGGLLEEGRWEVAKFGDPFFVVGA